MTARSFSVSHMSESRSEERPSEPEHTVISWLSRYFSGRSLDENFASSSWFPAPEGLTASAANPLGGLLRHHGPTVATGQLIMPGIPALVTGTRRREAGAPWPEQASPDFLAGVTAGARPSDRTSASLDLR